jgi:SAM-dependent methyltransferase
VTRDPLPVRLICPRCRIPGEIEAFLESTADGEGCTGCGAEYPRLDGIRCLLPDPPPELEAPDDPASTAFRERVLEAIYAISHWPDVDPAPEGIEYVRRNGQLRETFLRWLDRHPTPHQAAPAALEIGCGPGRFAAGLARRFPDGTVAIDIRPGLLGIAQRLTAGEGVTVSFRTEGTRFEDVRIASPGPAVGPVHFLLADATAPPFEAEIFPLVAALSVLDSTADPILFLGQADALLAPGGLLLLAQPWQWEPSVTPSDAWWSGSQSTGPESLRTLLTGKSAVLPHLDYEILEERDGIPWWLPGHRRLLHRYSLHAVLARKAAP